MLISKNFLTREASYKPSCLISWIHSGRSGTVVPRVGMQGSNADLGMRVACGRGYSALAELRYPHLDRHKVVHSIDGELPSLQPG